jgi:hypothetical protein
MQGQGRLTQYQVMASDNAAAVFGNLKKSLLPGYVGPS